MDDPLACDLCGRAIPGHGHYVVRIDVYADPSLPPTTAEELASGDFDAAMAGLMKEMEGLSADDLQDQVHRRFEYRLCVACQRQFLSNPLGKPRQTRSVSN